MQRAMNGKLSTPEGMTSPKKPTTGPACVTSSRVEARHDPLRVLSSPLGLHTVCQESRQTEGGDIQTENLITRKGSEKVTYARGIGRSTRRRNSSMNPSSKRFFWVSPGGWYVIYAANTYAGNLNVIPSKTHQQFLDLLKRLAKRKLY